MTSTFSKISAYLDAGRVIMLIVCLKTYYTYGELGQKIKKIIGAKTNPLEPILVALYER